ncbi:MAG: dUTP diphosphatase [Flavobacteriaceae bacterium]|nr:dUTP diphosphatase [Flavobacteriaceae bacterium]
MVRIPIVNESPYKLPEYATESSAGLDLRAFIANSIELKPLERVIIKTGLKLALPKGYEAQIRPRSGLAIKHGISVLNSPGTIDSDYRGEIGVILVNLSKNVYIIESGDRIAQMIIAKHEVVDWDSVKELSKSLRNEAGFGSTGKE